MISIPSRALSDVVWSHLSEKYQDQFIGVSSALLGSLLQCEGTRHLMTYQTGSIPLANAVALWLITREHQPKTIFELGTFIGKSTMSMGLAAPGAVIHTVDESNDFHLVDVPNVHPNPRTKSTDALKALAGPVDMFFIDGRIQLNDPEHMARLATSRTLIALDDFNDTEKGVANAYRLLSNPSFAAYYLVPPPSQAGLKLLGNFGPSNLALLTPPGYVQFARPAVKL